MTLNPADTAFADVLAQNLPPDTLGRPDARYLEEPRGRFLGRGLLARPRSAEEVATIVRACAAGRVGIVPYGGGTGLVGGQVMPVAPAPVILSLERMSAIRAIYPQENILIAEAGAILADVQAAAAGVDRLFPLSLAAEGTARIGGNLATNAGGVNVLRYGNARDLCLGLEAVLPTGEVWHGLSRLRKDNTGYDLRNLLVGSEGTLGVITAATLKLFPQPSRRETALMVVDNPARALDLLALTREMVGDAVSAFELVHRQGLEFLSEELPNIRLPFDELPEWFVLCELGLPASVPEQSLVEQVFADAFQRELATDGLVASSEGQRGQFWALREHIPEANRRIGSISSHDVSLPLGEIARFIDKAGPAVAKIADVRINCFGHLGDGNLHYNVFPAKGRRREDYEDQRVAIKEAVQDMVVSFGGSISAEHGIGRLKRDDLVRYGDPARLAAMRAIKLALDPAGIMNPGAVLV